MCAFVVAQLVATLIAVYAHISFAYIRGIGWGLAGVIGLYSLISYIPPDIIKFTTAFTSKKDYGTEDRAAQWVLSQRSLQGLMAADLEFNGRRSRSSLIAEQARRAEIARLGEIHTLRGHAILISVAYKPELGTICQRSWNLLSKFRNGVFNLCYDILNSLRSEGHNIVLQKITSANRRGLHFEV
ncbi:hypothetical protein Q3G72_003549 [Acer saccharum]|nr:hypothetical protein Q3G72_003549 [Acer saccharum]